MSHIALGKIIQRSAKPNCLFPKDGFHLPTVTSKVAFDVVAHKGHAGSRFAVEISLLSNHLVQLGIQKVTSGGSRGGYAKDLLLGGYAKDLLLLNWRPSIVVFASFPPGSEHKTSQIGRASCRERV